ncbi:hypothetical protein G7054_g204 [Neopestalotiopsis clavispora]|nr:hypothetical protein G7054_g204 [Neopestalotiopsis clavispora]
MSSFIDNKTLRNNNPAEQAQYLRKQLQSNSWELISDHLLRSIESGSVAPNVFHVWMGVCKSPDAIVAALRQNISNCARLTAIRRFGKWLRKDDTFAAIWDAVGGVQGLSELLSTFSVQHVSIMCDTICFSAPARGAKASRQQAITQLYDTLTGHGNMPNPDQRPLNWCYRRLLPTCTVDKVLEHTTKDKNHVPGRKFIAVHASSYEELALAAIFETDESKRKKITEYTHLFTNNRHFTMTVLDRIASDPSVLRFNGDRVISTLVGPALVRLHRARDRKAIAHVLRIALACADKEPKVAEKINASNLAFYAVYLWRRSPDDSTAKELLIKLIAFMPRKNCNVFRIPMQLMAGVEKRLRFDLLRLILLHTSTWNMDIDVETKADNDKIASLDKWPVDLFSMLDRPSAVQLFRRLWRILPDDQFTVQGNGELPRGVRSYTSKNYNSLDLHIVSASLESQLNPYPDEAAPWFFNVKKELAERKKQASNSRDPEERGKWAKSALDLCIAANSLNLLSETLLWARRYNRDHVTVERLYQHGPLSLDMVHDLLSGIPSHTRRELPQFADISGMVHKGNDIVLGLLETAGMGIQEPFFQTYSWYSVTRLRHEVLEQRISRTQALQKQHKISDGDIMHHIWEPTIQFLLKAERFLLQEENKELGLNSIFGPFNNGWWTVEEPSSSTGMFLDELARRRDELWKEYRFTIHPATADIQDPWPRGLPVQALCARLSSKDFNMPSMPYLDSRCKNVVFCESNMMDETPAKGSEDEEDIREAIGRFSDSYKFALSHYLYAAKGQADRDERLRKAWVHALGLFMKTTIPPERRMSDVMTVEFWKHYYCAKLNIPDMEKDLNRLGLLSDIKKHTIGLPEPDVNGTPVEWTPWLAGKRGPSNQPLRNKPELCLDHALWNDAQNEATVYSPFVENVKCWTGPSTKLPDWSGLDAPTPQHEDALIAAAIAYINTKYGSDSSLLLKAFPEEAEPRYPGLYLDQEFLEAYKNENASRPITVLRGKGSRVPIGLLRRLAQSLMQRLDSAEKKDPDLLKTTMIVVKMLVSSDCPRAATQLVQHVVLDRDDDSSWHRHVLNIGFLHRLSSADAAAFVNELSASMHQRHEQVAAYHAKKRAEKEASKDESNNLEAAPETHKSEQHAPPAHTKVSTIKMVAQMLENPGFIDQSTTCDILGTLLNSSSHPDVRYAIVLSLISMLEKTKQSKLKSQIWETLEKHVLPIVSSINERTPPKEREWLEAENDGALPEVYDAQPVDTMPELLTCLVEAASRWKKESPEYNEWVTRILLPVSVRSAVENTRWSALFVKRYKLDVAVFSLPAIPVKPTLLFKLWSDIPQARNKANFELLRDYLLVKMRPDESLQAAIDKVKEDKDISRSNGGKHWLYLWDGTETGQDTLRATAALRGGRGRGGFRARGGRGRGAITLPLSSGRQGKKTITSFSELGAVTVDDLSQIFKVLLDIDSKDEPQSVERIQLFWAQLQTDCITSSDVGGFEKLTSVIGKPLHKKQNQWKNNCLPMLKKAIKDVEALRTVEWQHNRDRNPEVLPQSLGVKVMILEGVYPTLDQEPSREEMNKFVAEYCNLLDEKLVDNVPFHEEWHNFRNVVVRRFPREQSLFVGLALAHGVNAQHPTLTDNLKITAIQELVQNFLRCKPREQLSQEDVDAMRELVEAWVNTPAEWVRGRGKDLENVLEAHLAEP